MVNELLESITTIAPYLILIISIFIAFKMLNIKIPFLSQKTKIFERKGNSSMFANAYLESSYENGEYYRGKIKNWKTTDSAGKIIKIELENGIEIPGIKPQQDLYIPFTFNLLTGEKSVILCDRTPSGIKINRLKEDLLHKQIEQSQGVIAFNAEQRQEIINEGKLGQLFKQTKLEDHITTGRTSTRGV